MKVKEKILVTGSKGQLGSEIQLLSKKYPDFVWVFTDQEELDLCALEQLTSKLTRIQPSIILNCAAYTAVDRAEDEKELAATLKGKWIAFAPGGCQEPGLGILARLRYFPRDNVESKLPVQPVFPPGLPEPLS